LAAVIRNRSISAGGGVLKINCWLYVCLNTAQHFISLSGPYSLSHIDKPCTALNTVHFRPGINAHVWCTPTHTAEMSCKDHCSCLMFDEMSIKENLHFNQKFECIEGFEDHGSQHSKSCPNFHGLWLESGRSQLLTTLIIEALRQR
jgi:hypothetical protein